MANAYERLRVERRELNKRSGWAATSTFDAELPPMSRPNPRGRALSRGLDARGRE